MRNDGPVRAVAVGALHTAAALLLIASATVADDPDMPCPDAEIVSISAVGEVRFPHCLHVDEIGFECSECHHETDATGLRLPHEAFFDECRSNCDACHAEGVSPVAPQGCSACHGTSPIASAADTMSAKVAIHRNCWSCHDSGTGMEATKNCDFCHDRGRVMSGGGLWTAAGF